MEEKDKDIEYVMPVIKEGESSRSEKEKKKRSTVSLIFAAAIFLIVIACVILFYPKSVTGEWELTVNPEVAVATPDQIDDADRVYYIFEKPNRYGEGKLSICYQGGIEYREYKLTESDDVEKINLGSVDLDYKITGSKVLGNAKITLIYPEYTDETTGQTVKAQKYVLEQENAPDYKSESYDDYETDSALLSQWTSNERTLSYFTYLLTYVQTVEFTDDGVMVIHYESADLALDRYMYYAYTAKDNELTFSLVTDKDTKYTVAYEFDDDGNLKFTDDTTTDSIFADAFFGEFTYYTPQNLPDATQPTQLTIATE